MGGELVDEEAGHVGVVEQVEEVTAKPFLQARRERLPAGRERFDERVFELADGVFDHAFVELLLRSEIVVEQGVRHAGGFGDGCGLRPVVAPGEELALGCPQDGLLPVPGFFHNWINIIVKQFCLTTKETGISETAKCFPEKMRKFVGRHL